MNLDQAESEHAGRTRRRRHCRNGHRFTTREVSEADMRAASQNENPPLTQAEAAKKFQQILQIIAAK